MAWNRTNWKTTVCGGLAAFGMVAGLVLPGTETIAKAAEALAVALFGYFAADAGTQQ
jgi:hypothetical protein